MNKLLIVCLISISASGFGQFEDRSGYQRPGKAIDPSEYQMPGRGYYENQMPGRPSDPTEYNLPGRGQLPGQDTRFSPEIDRRVLLDIQDALREGGSFSERFTNVYPQVNEGLVTLFGTVPSEMDKQDAYMRVSRIRGIRYINNQIIVQQR